MRALGKSTGHDKQLESPLKVNEAVSRAYQKVFEDLSDNGSYVCPLCYTDLEAKAYSEHRKPAKNAALEKLSHLTREHNAFLELIKKSYSKYLRNQTILANQRQSLLIQRIAQRKN